MIKEIMKIVGVAGLSLIWISALAQGKVDRPGYYTDRNGEKFEGFFAEKISQRNLKGVWFKENPGDEKEKILLEEISRIYLNSGEQYLIYELPGPNRLEQLILKKIVSGTTSLFRGNSSEKGTVFYWEGQGADGNLLIHRDNFSGFVNSVRLRCPAIKAAEYKFNQRDLTKMVIAYNECNDPGAEYVVLEEAAGFKYSIGVRPYWYSANLSQPGTAYYGRGDYSGKPGFSAALALAWIPTPRLRVMLEPSYARISSSSDYVNVPPYSEEGTFSEVTFEINNLELPLLLQYGFPLGRLRPFAEGGLYIGIPLSTRFEDNLTVASQLHYQYKPASVTFDEANFGYTVGVGLGWEIAPAFQLELMGRWTQSTSTMRVVTTYNQAGPLFHNFLINKLEVGVRFWWLGKGGK